MIKIIMFVILATVSAGWGKAIITGVTGQIKNDSVITISGTGFTSKSPAKPLVWADFAADINPTSLGIRTTWSDNSNMSRTTSAPAGAGTLNSSMGTWNSISAPTRSFSFGIELPSPYFQKVYTFGKRYYDFSATSNIKVWRLNPYTGYSPPYAEDPVFNYSSNNNWFAHLNECNSDNKDRFTDGHMWTKDHWSIEEVVWQFSGGSGKYYDGSTAAGSGIAEYTVDGVQIFRQESWNNCENVYGNLRMFDNFTPANIPTDTPATGSHVYMTYLYADTVFNRIIIGDRPTLAASTHREIQIPQTWSPTSITFTCVRGTFGSTDGAYLFVVDSANVASSGMSITLTPVKTTATVSFVMAPVASRLFKVSTGKFIVPFVKSDRPSHLFIYNLKGRLCHQSIVKKDGIDPQKDLGLPASVYIVKIRPFP